MGLSVAIREKMIGNLLIDLDTVNNNFSYACGSRFRPEAKQEIDENNENMQNLIGLLVDAVAVFIPESRLLKSVAGKILGKYSSFLADGELLKELVEGSVNVSMGISQEVFKFGVKDFLETVYPIGGDQHEGLNYIDKTYEAFNIGIGEIKKRIDKKWGDSVALPDEELVALCKQYSLEFHTGDRHYQIIKCNYQMYMNTVYEIGRSTSGKNYWSSNVLGFIFNKDYTYRQAGVSEPYLISLLRVSTTRYTFTDETKTTQVLPIPPAFIEIAFIKAMATRSLTAIEDSALSEPESGLPRTPDADTETIVRFNNRGKYTWWNGNRFDFVINEKLARNLKRFITGW